MVMLRQLPKAVRRKLLEVVSEEGRAVLILKRNGRLSTWHFEDYLATSERAKRVKPWLRRMGARSPTGPIGSQPLNIQGRLTREAIYEGR